MAALERRVALLCLAILFLSVFVRSDEELLNKDINDANSVHREKRAAVPGNQPGRGGANSVNFPQPGANKMNFQNINGNNVGGNYGNNFVPGNGNANSNKQRFQPGQGQVGQGMLNQGRMGLSDSQRGQARMHKNPLRKSQIRISDTEECGEEVQKYCAKNLWEKNFMVLDCLQNDLKMDEELSKECQHFLWIYKRNLTKDERFDHALKEMCKDDLQKLPECKNLERGKGQVIPCLIEYFDNVSSSACRQFLNKMATIVFSDYRLIYKFADGCLSDIEKFRCGRMEGDDDEMIHSQGRTLSCLAEKMTDLSGQCKLQVLRTYELQSDDFHLDRPLYYACRDDRERFCASTTAGGGKVFKCLSNHATEKTMSLECREKIELREKLMAQDVRVEKTFFKACKHDIEKNDCFSATGDHEDAKRASVLLCLENAAKTGRTLRGKCLAEMEDVRRMIMEDYKISPNLVARCAGDIENHCSDKDIGGETLHCLMGLARHGGLNKGITPECKAEVMELLREADVGSDYRLDRALHKACQSVVDKLCDDVPKGEGGVLNCLMENIDSDDMTDRCEEKLLEIQYFIMRDFSLDNQMYKRCRQFAKDLCNTPGNWHQIGVGGNTRERTGQVLACLYRHIRKPKQAQKKVSRACKQEIKRVMKAQALSVELNPAIQNACLKDLGQYCSEGKEDTGVGAEMECLQNNYEELEDECKKVVGELIEEQDEDIELDHILMKACTPMIKRFCDDLLDSDADPADVLECLIEHKNNHEMDSKCAAGVEHHQLISQKEFKFNHKFKEACQDSVKRFCLNKKTKSEVVVCLSEYVRNDTLLDNKQRIEKPCRHQLRLQILQREENIKLDPELQHKCSEDIQEYCSEITSGNSEVIECLKKKQRSLRDPCHRLLFKREKDEFAIADYGLLSSCKKMIKQYCHPDDDQAQILRCLTKHKSNPDFDSKCRSIVIRREIMQTKDYRLNPSLRKACHMDIAKFCSEVVDKHKQDVELEGKVIHCLKKQYAAKRLSRECDMEISEVVQQAAGDIREAPVLEKACLDEIYTHCKDRLVKGGSRHGDKDKELDLIEAGKGQVEECLKEQFRLRKLKNRECIKEVSYLIQEEEIDINVDPVLKSGCERELQKLCHGVRTGEGRLMSCLLSILEDDPKSLSKKCKTMLQKRKEMWEYAAQVAPIEGFQEIYTQISESPAKFYILGVLSAIVCMIFVFGIGCGRVSKRVRAELKNK